MRARSHPAPVGLSPFHLLAKISDDLMTCWFDGGDVAGVARSWRDLAAVCRAETAEVSRRLESEGVSVDIVYGLEVLERCLLRMEAMLDAIDTPHDVPRNEAVHRLLAALIVAAHDDRSAQFLIELPVQRHAAARVELDRKFHALRRRQWSGLISSKWYLRLTRRATTL